jgi:radical SAM superfamily enzyme YgiQ (UPF0313 family)
MEVLLINAPARKEKGYKEEVAYPLGLGYLYSYLESHGIEIGIFDLEVENFSIIEAAEIVAKKNPLLVGITFNSHNRFAAFDLVREIKKIAPEIHVTLGGHHVTNAPLDTIENTLADSIVCGEGEITLYELYKELTKKDKANLSKVKGIFYKEDNKIIKNPERALVENLDSLGFPNRRAFQMERYQLTMPGTILKKLKNQRYKGDNCAYIITSRGCPFKCSFCCTSATWKNKVRFHSAKHIVDEIEVLLKMGYNGILIYDDFFTSNKNHVFLFCNEMKARKLKVPLFCWARVNSITYEVFEKLREVGLVGVSMGIESGSPKILRYFQKGQTPKMILKAIRVLKDLNIIGKGTFIGMAPGETLLDTYYTAKLIDDIYKIQPEFIANSGYNAGLFIHPGTKIFNDLLKADYFPKNFTWTKKYIKVPEYWGVPVYRCNSTKIIKYTMKIMRKIIEIKRDFFYH